MSSVHEDMLMCRSTQALVQVLNASSTDGHPLAWAESKSVVDSLKFWNQVSCVMARRLWRALLQPSSWMSSLWWPASAVSRLPGFCRVPENLYNLLHVRSYFSELAEGDAVMVADITTCTRISDAQKPFRSWTIVNGRLCSPCRNRHM